MAALTNWQAHCVHKIANGLLEYEAQQVCLNKIVDAVPFRNWVCKQVLPSICKTGTYTGQMPLEELGGLMTDLPALIAKENSSSAQRDFKVRDVVIVSYGQDNRRKAIILDFLDRYIYVKFLDNNQTDFVVASQIEVKQ